MLPPAAEVQKLAERFGKVEARRRIEILPETARMICHALNFYADCVAMPKDEGGFTVDVWNADGVLAETIARSPNGLVARAAYEQACQERPRNLVTLRQGVRMVEQRPAPS